MCEAFARNLYKYIIYSEHIELILAFFSKSGMILSERGPMRHSKKGKVVTQELIMMAIGMAVVLFIATWPLRGEVSSKPKISRHEAAQMIRFYAEHMETHIESRTDCSDMRKQVRWWTEVVRNSAYFPTPRQQLTLSRTRDLIRDLKKK